ncbi:MAG TPA: PPK2 family polyphosphate kinase [Solirubrobacteraceae bacterium]|jgi:PPK2 family polyphosphate:nucleotide phosphotransferase|nr:PPK2 family polyphosphate kinase [Solirubrobacteraceae bacterium]
MPDPRIEQVTELIEHLRVAPDATVKLARDFDPSYKAGWARKQDAQEQLEFGVHMLAEYQDRLAAEGTRSVLVVLQGIDAAGKDGTIRHVMSGVNPQGVSVRSFKVPTDDELRHDFLWRYQCALPGRGQIGLFNRSHYEDVLVVRVHPDLLNHRQLRATGDSGDLWKRRYEAINSWERHLSDNGYKVVKLFLNLSKEEQRTRFLKRIDLAEKNWKFSSADAREREHWDDYQHAFSEMLSHTSTECAPWHVIPADRKWFARIAAAAVIVQALVALDPRYPTVSDEDRRALGEARAALVAEAPPGAPADPFEAAQD